MTVPNLCNEVLENAIKVHETCENAGCEITPLDAVAVQAMKELLRYRQIGTVEECREAVEKQTAKKVKSIFQVKDGDNYIGLIGRCPCCGDILEEDTVYCDCGQRLDWEGE